MIKPVISEKSMGLASRGWYTFAVPLHARKEQIAGEVGRTYRVDVLGVRTVAMHGKVRRTGRKMITTRKADWKKAMVLLREGQKIDAFEVTQEQPAEEPKKTEAPKEEKPVTKTKKVTKKTVKK